MSNIRDTSFGQLARLITGNRVFLHPEEQPDFQLPAAYLKLLDAADSKESSIAEKNNASPAESTLAGDLKLDEEAPPVEDPSAPKILEDGTIIVDWYGPSDPANPKNWPSLQKILAAGIIILYTFAIYLGSSIFTASYGGVIEKWGVSVQVCSLTLSMYVLAYGLGPMLWSPLSEIPSLGRGPLYMVTYALFVILLVPTALVNTFGGLVVLRFLLGFFGSPCLATGPASLGDMYNFDKLPYAMMTWAIVATSGPALGPMISGYSVPKTSWRWSTWELLYLSGPLLIAFFFLVPETSASTILLRRAQRLRLRTGQTCLRSQGEIDQSKLQPRQVVMEALWRPVQTMVLDPSIAFTAVYVALIYGIYYSFFEAFPIVFGTQRGFSLGGQGLIYLSILIGILVGVSFYALWIRKTWEPAVRSGNLGPPEDRLVPALFGACMLPIGLFLFAWTSKPSIHWIAPCFGIGILSSGIFLIMQPVFLYLPLSYPQYAASLFAGNSVARSVLAAAIVHASQPLYHNLGVPRGVSLLGGLTVGCIGGIFTLWHFGAALRARSKFAA